MSRPSQSLKILVFGHENAQLSAIARTFSGEVSTGVEASKNDFDLAIFAINPADGIDQATIENWDALNESQVPRLIVVTGLENSQADFDDAVLLANRVFDQTVTPFLVLHDDEGAACALISLKDLSIRNYATFPPSISQSESEHRTLVAEFRQEYLDQMEMMGEDSFSAGLIFPAIPLWIEKNIGVDIVESYIDQLLPG